MYAFLSAVSDRGEMTFQFQQGTIRPKEEACKPLPRGHHDTIEQHSRYLEFSMSASMPTEPPTPQLETTRAILVASQCHQNLLQLGQNRLLPLPLFTSTTALVFLGPPRTHFFRASWHRVFDNHTRHLLLTCSANIIFYSLLHPSRKTGWIFEEI